jgi:arylsulfatase A-like enzyme
VVNEVAFDFLDRHENSRYFLFLHYMDPHDPYFEHPYNGRAVARVAGDPDATRAEELRALYKGEIEYLDANIGKLFAKLRGQGVWDDTLIALTSDHGEELQEHGGWWHGLTLYDEQIHVPLLIKWQKGGESLGAGNEHELARLIDVAPTLVARTGAAIPAAMQGFDLAKPASSRAVKDREVFSEEDHEGNVLWSLRTRDTKLIHANAGNARGLPEKALFDILRDPGEQQNLAGDGRLDLEQQLAMHADAQRRAAEGGAVEGGGDHQMDRDECEQLRQLGYVDDCSHLTN